MTPPSVAQRAWRLLRAPSAAWAAIAIERQPPGAVLLHYVLPMSLLPALAWMLGSYFFPEDIGGTAANASAAALLRRGLWTFLGSLLTVALLAAALAVVAPMYERPRDAAGALRVAGYGLTPVWLAGVLLVKPVLVLVLVLAAMQSCVLLHGGVRAVLGVRPEEASEYVAVSLFLTAAASTFVGGGLAFLELF